jgi:Fe2+ or Zn2+ uptake regulation protein
MPDNLNAPLPLHLTRQRRLVLDILRSTPGHSDAGTIYLEARKRNERISLATVYRALDWLKKAGLVEEDHLGEEHGHFEPAQGAQHYHFTCIGCGKVFEVGADGILEMVRALSQQNQLLVTEIHLYLRGYCPDCRENHP